MTSPVALRPGRELLGRPLAAVQTRLGEALRARVAGDDAAERAQQIWGTPGERWFAPGDPIWRVHEDAAMFPGGIAALLLQSLHPLAMAGVAGHSGFRGDPWGRLQRTSHYLAVTTYGTVEHAERAVAQARTLAAAPTAPTIRSCCAGSMSPRRQRS
jgi:uncharacterized protein (DUF2236 family)